MVTPYFHKPPFSIILWSRMVKYIFVTGGVLSSVGKGITTASIAKIIQARGYSVTAVKIDPYINVDAGTMNPYMHGEVYVTEDGGETDLDIGHYERFLGKNLSKRNNITTGKVYLNVIERERRGNYLGKCVQIIPHVTDEIKRLIKEAVEGDGADIGIVEIGGTVGDIEGLPFLEAIRQMRFENGAENTFYVHVGLVPILDTTGEQKTKPLQHSIQELRRIGIQPDMVIGRCRSRLSKETIRKIALYGNIPPEMVISSHDVDTVYEVPLVLESQSVSKKILERLGLEAGEPDLTDLEKYVKKWKSLDREIEVAMIGKYTRLRDSYISIVEAVKHASTYEGVRPRFRWIESTDIENGRVDLETVLDGVSSAIILPGFGKRGAEGKISALKKLREEGIPTLGICFGFQLMVVEYARNVLGLEGANSTEIDPNTPHPVIDLMEEQRREERLGGTMRLGAYEIRLRSGTLVHSIYGRDVVYERHRHRYEVNPKYWEKLFTDSLVDSGRSYDDRIEFIELKQDTHPFYIGTQAHPEFKSRYNDPAPLFKALLKASLKKSLVV